MMNMYTPSFIDTRPLDTEISRHAKYVLMDSGRRDSCRANATTTRRTCTTAPTGVGRGLIVFSVQGPDFQKILGKILSLA